MFKADRQRKCEVAAGPGVLLVKPSTFMNESGLCVGPMMRFFKLDPRSVFVIHDEVDFPLGVIKLREKGSAGGHNGIKSLIAHMGTQEFPRLRFGIGQPRGKGEMIGHVLGKFRPEERELLDVMLGKAAGRRAVHHGTRHHEGRQHFQRRAGPLAARTAASPCGIKI
ncbi:MAG: aminoacyl-tRNA hydrolase [Akkermansia sp.]